MERSSERGPEQELALLEPAVDRGTALALMTIERNFELSAHPENNLAFHNRVHTHDVVRRTGLILEALQRADPQLVSERDIVLGRFTASAHDIVQAWKAKEIIGQFGPERVRQRAIGDNETASVDWADGYMDKVNDEAGAEIFTDKDRSIVGQAINVTVPTWQPQLKTVIQERLTSDNHPVVWAVAMSDLGTAGMEEPDTFLHDGDNLYREMNLDLAELLPIVQTLSPDRQEQLRQRMLQWSSGQIDYCIGRKKAFSQELTYLSLAGQKAVEELFCYFNATIKYLGQVYEQRKKMSVTDLAVDMGYELK